jgi:DNA-binding transcriptional LysR family regulator
MNGAAPSQRGSFLLEQNSLPIIRRYWSEVSGRERMFKAAAVLPDLRSLVRAAVSGASATVVPDCLCQEELRTGKLTQHRSVGGSPVNQIKLAW